MDIMYDSDSYYSLCPANNSKIRLKRSTFPKKDINL